MFLPLSDSIICGINEHGSVQNCNPDYMCQDTRTGLHFNHAVTVTEKLDEASRSTGAAPALLQAVQETRAGHDKNIPLFSLSNMEFEFKSEL